MNYSPEFVAEKWPTRWRVAGPAGFISCAYRVPQWKREDRYVVHWSRDPFEAYLFFGYAQAVRWAAAVQGVIQEVHRLGSEWVEVGAPASRRVAA